jgi:hypothetical protein
MKAAEHPLSPEELMAYLDGELQSEQAAVVQAHLVGCDVCQRLSGELRGVSRDIARWQVEDAPATLRAPSTPPDTETIVRSRFNWLFRPSIAYGLAAASIVGVVTIAALSSWRAKPPTLTAAMPAVDESGYAPSVGKTAGASANVPETSVQAPVMGESLRYGKAGAAVVGGQSAAGQASTAPAPGPSIARAARLRLRTSDFDAARPVVDRVVADTGGLVGQVTVSGTRGDARSLTATLLVPASRLDGALAALKSIGLVVQESQSGDDVTDQVIDIGARLSNARNAEKRLVDLLQKRTGDLADVLAAEREITRVREEIERFDAQRKNLERRVTYATLTLEVAEQQHAALDLGPQPISGRFRDAFVTGISQALDSALALSLLVVRIAPVLLLWIVLLAWPVRAIVRRARRPARL